MLDRPRIIIANQRCQTLDFFLRFWVVDVYRFEPVPKRVVA